MYWILAAIDGTDSESSLKKDGSNSSIFKFHRDFDTPKDLKMYSRGPNDTTLGRDSIGLLKDVMSFLIDAVQICHDQSMKKNAESMMMNHPEYIAKNFNDIPRANNAFVKDQNNRDTGLQQNDDIRICLVGHSRGGLIAIMAAQRLKIIHRKVYFMGLYDAVDRQPSLDGSSITNAEIVYHARRDIWRGISRPYFSSTGTKVGDAHSRYNEDFFVTSHGGVGGDWGISGTQYVDLILAIPFPIRLIDILNAKSSELLHKKPERLFEMESKNADQYIRMGARSAALPI